MVYRMPLCSIRGMSNYDPGVYFSICCAPTLPRSRLFSTDDDVTSPTTKVQALGRWSQGPAWMRLGRLLNRGDTASK